MEKYHTSTGLCLLMVFGAFTILSPGAAADMEPNDDFSTAEFISSGKMNGTLSKTDKNDYYKFELDAGQRFTINFSHDDGPGHPKVIIYDKSKKEWKKSDGIPLGMNWSENFTIGSEEAGTYYIHVIDDALNDRCFYNFSLDVFEQMDANQPGDAPDHYTARTITPGKYSGWLGDFDDDDTYNISVPAGNRIDINISVGNESGTLLNADLFSGSITGKWIRDISPGTTAALLSFQTSDAYSGFFIFKISHLHYGVIDGISYAFCVNLTPENDAGSGTDVPDSIKDAYSLPGPGTYSGVIMDNDVADMYAVNLTAGQTISYTLTNEGAGKITLTVEDPEKDEIPLKGVHDLAPNRSYTNTFTAGDTTGGTYYFWLGGACAYTLTYGISSQNDANFTGDAGSTIATARSIRQDTAYSGYMNDADKMDYYSFPGERGTKVVISYNNIAGDGFLRVSVIGKDERIINHSVTQGIGIPAQLEYEPTTTGIYYLLFESPNSNYSFSIRNIDIIKPDVKILVPVNGAKLKTQNLPAISGTASDNVAVQSVELKVNGNIVPVTGTVSWNATNAMLQKGTNVLEVTATDASGNINRTTISVTYEKPAPPKSSTPGFEALMFMPALIAGLAAYKRKRRSMPN